MARPIEQHYSREYLFENILANLERSGIDKNAVTRKDLAGVDEFHVRGLEATMELANMAALQRDMKVLDVGCGIGGPCRLLADEYGCITTGVDITREYIRTATLLSGLVGLQDRTNFIHASALELPFAPESFDAVWTQHAQVNIEDKKQFYSEIGRVLKPGGSFIYYDILSVKKKDIHFPVPWADNASISFLITQDQMHKLFVLAGLEQLQQIDQTASGLQFLNILLDRINKQGIQAVSLKLLIGALLPQKLQNLHNNLLEKRIELESGICIKPQRR